MSCVKPEILDKEAENLRFLFSFPLPLTHTVDDNYKIPDRFVRTSRQRRWTISHQHIDLVDHRSVVVLQIWHFSSLAAIRATYCRDRSDDSCSPLRFWSYHADVVLPCSTRAPLFRVKRLSFSSVWGSEEHRVPPEIFLCAVNKTKQSPLKKHTVAFISIQSFIESLVSVFQDEQSSI